jgi:methylenetetrahydrofolate dehydrogenase (NADP+) / methenyltetrahydrofolate cyclohydrolase
MLDGTVVAAAIKSDVKSTVAELRAQHGAVPTLVAVRVGDDPASAVYVANKIKACAEVGIRSELLALEATTSTSELLNVIASLNKRVDVDAILVQLPLPTAIHESAVIEAIDPSKDVDGFHPINVGLLALGKPRFIPCTPAGIIELLTRNEVAIAGASACVVGRSQIVGRPMAQLLLQSDATVTICHSKTRDLPSVTREADILIAAIGRAGFIGAEHIKPGAVVVDVGMNKLIDADAIRRFFGSEADRRLQVLAKRGYTLIGDVNPAEADTIAGSRTPVPGGVGLLTVAMLMKNTLQAAQWRRCSADS